MKERRNRKIWGPREEYRPILDRVIKDFPSVLEHIKPERIFLCGFLARRSRFLAKISPNKTPWNLLTPDFDYAIQFHDPRYSKMDRYKQRAVMFHELFHIPPGGFEVGGPAYRKTKRHDVEDFSPFIKLYGIHLEKAGNMKQGESLWMKESGSSSSSSEED